MQHGLARDAETAGGVVERDEPVGDVGHEAGADLVVEADPPGRVGGRLLTGQQTVSEPASDGCGRDAELAGGAVVKTSWLLGSGGGAAGMPARGAWRGRGPQ